MVKKDIQKSLSASLTLPKILANTLGFEDLHELLKALKENNLEEYEFTTDKSNFMSFILDYFNAKSIPQPFNILTENKLVQYDLNIKEHITKINVKRDIRFKAFQYVPMLITEIYLDKYLEHKSQKDTDQFLIFLNSALKLIKKYIDSKEYTKEDLEKLCYWMATGSGKTLIMHINYLQYLYYAEKYNQEINNIILITPNEDLSKQHHKNFKDSEIKSIITSKQNYSTKTDIIKIIDINKLKEKSGKVTIDYHAFGKNNLILVDEGHRGSSGKTWMEYRSKIAKEGFTLEYSATFQDTKKGNDYMSDYKKTIIYDYSYKYFHSDGYGKDYNISNADLKDDESSKDLIMLANLLSFYEQKTVFNKHKKEVIEKLDVEDPLWILVGSRVVEGKDKIDEKTKSDILRFAKFLHDLKAKRNYFITLIEKILTGKTSLKDKATNESFFKNKFPYLRKKLIESNSGKIYTNIMNLIFYSKNNEASLVLENIKNSDGEVGLRYQDSKRHFGLIYVGKGNDKKVIDSAKKIGIKTSGQSIKESLFQTLGKKNNQPINILIGARKFIEGWDNYRISSMLLMNFAKNKGVSAIQLFGRGVRIHGYNNSMKRSTVIHPPISSTELKEYLQLLETLNVFGIQANYMDAFREELKEDIEFYIEKEIFIHQDPYGLLKYDLKCVKEDKNLDENFKNNNLVTIQPIALSINLDKHISSISSTKSSNQKIISKINAKEVINETYFSLVNWENIAYELRRFKRLKDYRNISVMDSDKIKDILLKAKEKITFYGDPIGAPKSYTELIRLKEMIERIYIEIITKIASRSYSIEFKKHYQKNLKVVKLNNVDDIPDRYRIKINLNEKGDIKGDEQSKRFATLLLEQEELVDIKKLYEKMTSALIDKNKFFIEFDKHIYFPLLISSSNGTYSLTPKGLNEGEKKFIVDLKKIISKISNDTSLILLRNHENIGFGYFLEENKFYPDFILWAITDKKQRIIFIDPKGLVHLDKDKVNFHNIVKNEYEPQLKKRHPDENIELFSFIITDTKKHDIPDDEIKKDPEKFGIYFFDDDNYLVNMLEKCNIKFINSQYNIESGPALAIAEKGEKYKTKNKEKS